MLGFIRVGLGLAYQDDENTEEDRESIQKCDLERERQKNEG